MGSSHVKYGISDCCMISVQTKYGGKHCMGSFQRKYGVSVG